MISQRHESVKGTTTKRRVKNREPRPPHRLTPSPSPYPTPPSVIPSHPPSPSPSHPPSADSGVDSPSDSPSDSHSAHSPSVPSHHAHFRCFRSPHHAATAAAATKEAEAEARYASTSPTPAVHPYGHHTLHPHSTAQSAGAGTHARGGTQLGAANACRPHRTALLRCAVALGEGSSHEAEERRTTRMEAGA